MVRTIMTLHYTCLDKNVSALDFIPPARSPPFPVNWISFSARALRNCAGFGGPRLRAGRAACGACPKLCRMRPWLSDGCLGERMRSMPEVQRLARPAFGPEHAAAKFFCAGSPLAGCKKILCAKCSRACVFTPASPEGGETAARSRGALFCAAKNVKMRRQRRFLPPEAEAWGWACAATLRLRRGCQRGELAAEA